MAKIRVFELAKEYNLPAQRLIQQIRSIGISVENSFNVLSDEEATSIRKVLSGAPGASAKPAARKERKRISKRSADVEETAEESPKVVRRIRKGGRSAAEEEVEAEVATAEETVEATENVPEVEATPEETTETTENAPEVEAAPEETAETTESAPEVEAAPEKTAETTESAPDTKESEAKKATVAAAEKTKPQDTKAEAPKIIKKAEPAPAKVPASAVEEEPSSDKPSLSHPKDKKKPKKDAKKSEFVMTTPAKALVSKGIRAIEKEGFVSKKHNHRNIRVADSDPAGSRAWNRSARRSKVRVSEKAARPKHQFEPRKKSIKVGDFVTVSDLAGLIGIKVTEIIRKLMTLGVMATVNQSIPGETAALVASEFNVTIEQEVQNPEERLQELLTKEEPKDFKSRAPVVTIMGHVDHGKTSLLDSIRSAQVASGEAGGITQHIGAYHVETSVGSITFLDTPGHEAFTAMRARGANVTDIVILVVAADDSVQPQTIEAIHHAQAADVPIIVAINKIDRPQADPQRVQNDLLEHNLVSEDLGGDTLFVRVSAKTGEGLESLLEMVQLQAEVLELKAPVDGAPRGIIIEAQMTNGRGPVGTVLIQQGTLKPGDYYLVGETFGRVRALLNDHGNNMDAALPSIPVEILGFNAVPEIGETFVVVEDEKVARQISEMRALRKKEEIAARRQKTHLEDLFSNMGSDGQVELKLLIKADVQGSAEALENTLLQLSQEQVSVRCIHSAVGNITESDIMLASASDAVIIGFNVKQGNKARDLGVREGIDVRTYSVIYDAVDDVRKSLEGLLKPVAREEVLGHCEIRKVYSTSKGAILGCYVTDGKLIRSAKARLMRADDVIYEGSIQSLKRFKDDVKEVLNNYECGVSLGFDEVEEGDVIEAFHMVEDAATLAS